MRINHIERLAIASEVIAEAALDLRLSLGLTDVGQRDFFGNPIPSPAGGDDDIGAHAFALAGERRIDLLYLLFWAGSQNRSAQLIAYG